MSAAESARTSVAPDEADRSADWRSAVVRAIRERRLPVRVVFLTMYDDVTWVSSYDVNPFHVSLPEKAALLIDWVASKAKITDKPSTFSELTGFGQGQGQV